MIAKQSLELSLELVVWYAYLPVTSCSHDIVFLVIGISQTLLGKSAVLASSSPDQLTTAIRPLCAITDPAKVHHGTVVLMHAYRSICSSLSIRGILSIDWTVCRVCSSSS